MRIAGKNPASSRESGFSGRRLTKCNVGPSRKTRMAFSIVEAVISIVLVSGVMVAALNTVGASFASQRGIADRSRGQLLAGALMTEILATEYEDPNETIVFGLEASESVSTNRSLCDDVDDYRNLVDSPPTLKSGTAIAEFTGWSRSVAVLRVNTSDLNTSATSETGAKKIIVTVKRGQLPVATLVGIKTKVSPAAGKSRSKLEDILVTPF